MDKMRAALFAEPAYTAPVTKFSLPLESIGRSVEAVGREGDRSEEEQICQWAAEISKAISSSSVSTPSSSRERGGLFGRKKKGAVTTPLEVELLGVENARTALLQLLKMRDEASVQLQAAEHDVAAHKIPFAQLVAAQARFDGFREAFDREKEKMRRQYQERCGEAGLGVSSPNPRGASSDSSLVSPSVKSLKAEDDMNLKSPGSPALVRKGDEFNTVLQRIKDKIAEKEKAMMNLELTDPAYYYAEAVLASLQINLVNMHKVKHEEQRASAALEMPSLPRLVAVMPEVVAANLPVGEDELGLAEAELDLLIGDAAATRNVDADLDDMLAGLDNI